MALRVLLVLCGIWSLDFFRPVIPPFCVSNKIKAIHTLALEYLVAFYPICLIILTYSFIKLHDNNFKAIVGCGSHFIDTLFTSGESGTQKHQ